ncbi:flagellar protein FliT [Pseudomonas luteola]|uniref:flagellar protein FliT n=1 Tax=Pseudomonas luteola TaxID=47886 RepID=UPI003A89FAB8
MATALQRLDETKNALAYALHSQDWDAISSLDLICRVNIDEAMSQQPRDDDALRLCLEELLTFYGKLIYASRMQRNELAKDAAKMKHSQRAANVYKIFG